MSDMLISTSPAEPERELGRFPIADAAAVAADRTSRKLLAVWSTASYSQGAKSAREST